MCIFLQVNTSRTGKLSLREIYHSNVLQEFMHVDEEPDINRVTEYFSYEHFYVLYCRFFELDVDKDSLLSRENLMKYGDHALSEVIVDRRVVVYKYMYRKRLFTCFVYVYVYVYVHE